jgi:Domain of unknown function (DUF4336)
VIVEHVLRMKPNAYAPYDPLETLKPFANQVWIVDGPEIGMSVLGLTFHFPTRMTVVRLANGDLWLHSPIALSERLARSIAALGPVRRLIAPNTFHYSYLASWRDRFPEARTYGAPGLAEKAKARLVLNETLRETPPDAWGDAFDQCVTRGSVLTEVDFFHRASRTLIVTDLIENFEPQRVRNPLLRSLIRMAGAADPDGKAPIDMRLSFLGHRGEVRKSARRMLAWAPERIILSHGRCYETNGVAELRRAFRWIL